MATNRQEFWKLVQLYLQEGPNNLQYRLLGPNKEDLPGLPEIERVEAQSQALLDALEVAAGGDPVASAPVEMLKISTAEQLITVDNACQAGLELPSLEMLVLPVNLVDHPHAKLILSSIYSKPSNTLHITSHTTDEKDTMSRYNDILQTVFDIPCSIYLSLSFMELASLTPATMKGLSKLRSLHVFANSQQELPHEPIQLQHLTNCTNVTDLFVDVPGIADFGHVQGSMPSVKRVEWAQREHLGKGFPAFIQSCSFLKSLTIILGANKHHSFPLSNGEIVETQIRSLETFSFVVDRSVPRGSLNRPAIWTIKTSINVMTEQNPRLKYLQVQSEDPFNLLLLNHNNLQNLETLIGNSMDESFFIDPNLPQLTIGTLLGGCPNLKTVVAGDIRFNPSGLEMMFYDEKVQPNPSITKFESSTLISRHPILSILMPNVINQS